MLALTQDRGPQVDMHTKDIVQVVANTVRTGGSIIYIPLLVHLIPRPQINTRLSSNPKHAYSGKNWVVEEKLYLSCTH